VELVVGAYSEDGVFDAYVNHRIFDFPVPQELLDVEYVFGSVVLGCRFPVSECVEDDFLESRVLEGFCETSAGVYPCAFIDFSARKMRMWFSDRARALLNN
jgi:hypothetical protein